MTEERTLHLVQLTRDIVAWQTRLERLEREGEKHKARQVRGWIKSAQQLIDRINGLQLRESEIGREGDTPSRPC